MGNDQDNPCGATVSGVRPRWHRVLGIVLLAAFVASWFVWGPPGVVFFVGGLFNSLWVFVLGPFLFLLVPAAAIFLLVQMVRTVSRWPGLSPRQKWRQVLLLVVVFAFPASFALSLAGVLPSPFDMHVRGFTRYIERRTEVETIQTWLSSLDPNICVNEGGYAQDRRLVAAEQPPCIASLDAKKAILRPDDTGRPAVRLLWGGGMIGHWGLVVGHKDMPIPPSDSSEFGELRWPLAPGAYIWSGE